MPACTVDDRNGLQLGTALVVLLRRSYVFAFACLSVDRITQKLSTSFHEMIWRVGCVTSNQGGICR